MTQEIIDMANKAGFDLNMWQLSIGCEVFGTHNELLAFAKLVAEKALAEHAMREVQRLGQEIEQEPVAWLSTDSIGERYLCFDKPIDNDPVQPLFTTPPQRTQPNDIDLFWRAATTPEKWVGLTDEEIWETISRTGTSDADVNPYAKLSDARAIEAKLKEKNT
jgi:hypothetical protein